MGGIAIEQQAQQHFRSIRFPTARPVMSIQGREVKQSHAVHHKAGQMAGLTQTHRQIERLLRPSYYGEMEEIGTCLSTFARLEKCDTRDAISRDNEIAHHMKACFPDTTTRCFIVGQISNPKALNKPFLVNDGLEQMRIDATTTPSGKV